MTAAPDRTTNDELTALTTDVGEQALALLRAFIREQLPQAELQQSLRELNAGQVMARHWGVLTTDPARADGLGVLQLVNSLEDNIEGQVQCYGESSLWDDLKELQTGLRRIRHADASRSPS